MLFFGAFILVIYFCIPSTNFHNCTWNEDFGKMKFEGVIQKKYLDKSNHSTPTVVLIDFQNNMDTLDLFGEDTGVYEAISLGDTIKKPSGTRQMLKMRNNEYVVFKTAEFGCDSTKLKKEEYLFGVYNLIGND